MIWKAAYHLDIPCCWYDGGKKLAWVSCRAAAGGTDVQHVLKKPTASKMAIHTFRKINYVMRLSPTGNWAKSSGGSVMISEAN